MAKDRNQLKAVETYDGNAKRPFCNQLSGTDSTTSQAFYTAQKDVTTAGTPEQLPNKAINPGMQAVIKAKLSNSTDITIGKDSTDALESSSANLRLTPGAAVTYKVDNFNRIWIDAETSGDGTELTIV